MLLTYSLQKVMYRERLSARPTYLKTEGRLLALQIHYTQDEVTYSAANQV